MERKKKERITYETIYELLAYAIVGIEAYEGETLEEYLERARRAVERKYGEKYKRAEKVTV